MAAKTQNPLNKGWLAVGRAFLGFYRATFLGGEIAGKIVPNSFVLGHKSKYHYATKSIKRTQTTQPNSLYHLPYLTDSPPFLCNGLTGLRGKTTTMTGNKSEPHFWIKDRTEKLAFGVRSTAVRKISFGFGLTRLAGSYFDIEHVTRHQTGIGTKRDRKSKPVPLFVLTSYFLSSVQLD